MRLEELFAADVLDVAWYKQGQKPSGRCGRECSRKWAAFLFSCPWSSVWLPIAIRVDCFSKMQVPVPSAKPSCCPNNWRSQYCQPQSTPLPSKPGFVPANNTASPAYNPRIASTSSCRVTSRIPFFGQASIAVGGRAEGRQLGELALA